MGYTDPDLTGKFVKKQHLTELKTAIQTLGNSKKVPVQIDISSSEKITSANVKQLQNAIHKLQSKFSNNCCQANCCQTCQGCQTCQVCQGCQSCQTCQTNQECYKPNCDCNCGDDGG
jgi:hypothetical protein